MNNKQIQTIRAYDRSAEQFEASVAKLPNYNHTYDFLLKKLNDGDHILDLACGPAQISTYLKERKNINVVGVDLSDNMLALAQRNIPDGTFYKHSILDFQSIQKFDSIILGFGIPYLNEEQTMDCIKNSVTLLKDGKYLYISFMHGNRKGFEKTSFGGPNQFFIYYHDKYRIRDILSSCGLNVIKEYELDYIETDGSVSNDVAIIAMK